jgi:hypothetical protein
MKLRMRDPAKRGPKPEPTYRFACSSRSQSTSAATSARARQPGDGRRSTSRAAGLLPPPRSDCCRAYSVLTSFAAQDMTLGAEHDPIAPGQLGSCHKPASNAIDTRQSSLATLYIVSQARLATASSQSSPNNVEPCPKPAQVVHLLLQLTLLWWS